MAVTTLSTQIFQYREDTANPPIVGSVGTVVQNPMSGNGISIAGGGTSTVVGNYQIITFTGSGSFTVNQSGNVELMMIGGGGASTYQTNQGGATPGASAGGLIYYGSNPWEFKSGPAITLAAGTTYTVTIGAGATAQVGSTSSRPSLAAGSNTSITGGSINLTAYGGQGTHYYYSTQANTGYTGAPGAGGSYWKPGYAISGDTYFIYYYTGTNPAPNQGYQGGSGYYNATTPAQPGGGGAGSPGGNQGTGSSPGNGYGWGGNGFLTDISGTTAWYGGGGGGGGLSSGLGVGAVYHTYGGRGGGGDGGSNDGTYYGGSVAGSNNGAGGNGGINTGGGGGGNGCFQSTGGGGGTYGGTSGSGGSGVLIMKIPLYSISTDAITAAQNNLIATGNTATGGTVTYSGNYRIHTFTGSGTFTAAHTGYIEYLCIAGGGGGGGGQYSPNPFTTAYGGGGGAGGYLEHYSTSTIGANFQGPRLYVNAGDTITVVVGAGGASYAGSSISGNLAIPPSSGSDSYVYNTTSIVSAIAYGGGAGGHGFQSGTNNTSIGPMNGRIGGSGGAGSNWSGQMNGSSVSLYGSPGSAIGEYGTSVRQGYSGATSTYGGGAGGTGQGASTVNNKEANNGKSSSITGASVTYAAGGAQKVYANDLNYFATVNSGNGGIGGTSGLNAQAVSGSNGLSSPEWYMAGKSGGSGIVIIRYRFQ